MKWKRIESLKSVGQINNNGTNVILLAPKSNTGNFIDFPIRVPKTVALFWYFWHHNLEW